VSLSLLAKKKITTVIIDECENGTRIVGQQNIRLLSGRLIAPYAIKNVGSHNFFLRHTSNTLGWLFRADRQCTAIVDKTSAD